MNKGSLVNHEPAIDQHCQVTSDVHVNKGTAKLMVLIFYNVALQLAYYYMVKKSFMLKLYS